MMLRIGSRDSELARLQSRPLVDQLDEMEGTRADLITTDEVGDVHPDEPIEEIGQTGVFSGSLNRMVLEGELDAAVHSLKDCETTLPEGLVLGAVPPRATPFDMLVGREPSRLEKLPAGTIVGTSSRRRRANLLYHNPKLEVRPCRGNVPTRLKKLRDENQSYEALVLAAAGLERLGKPVKQMVEKLRLLSQDEMLPAPGQGALAVVCREEDEGVRTLLETLDHRPSRLVCAAERSFLNRLEGGCQAPVGALARRSGDQLVLRGTVTSPDGSTQMDHSQTGEAGEAEELGVSLADTLLEKGAAEVVDS